MFIPLRCAPEFLVRLFAAATWAGNRGRVALPLPLSRHATGWETIFRPTDLAGKLYPLLC
jgi:hypothetical protein